MYLIGLPVTCFMLSAAPPLASPSILVRIIPDKFTVVLNSFATFTAICPVSESATKIVSAGFVIFLICFISDIIGKST